MKPKTVLSNDNSNDKWLDNQDVLMRMHISGRTLHRWRRKKILPFSRIGNKIYYRESDLQSLLEKNLRNTSNRTPL
jgi:predicted site-specific integrase-resolvase